MTILLIIVGLVLLAVGGDVLVRGAVGVSTRLGVSPLLAGLTIVGFGTSTPELVTSLFAAFDGAPGIAVGNIVGSNIANILLILGVSALILPLAIDPAAFRRDGLALAVATLACLAVVLLGFLSRPVGFALLALLVGYIVWAYRSERRHPDAESVMHEHVAADVTSPGMSLIAALGLAAVGIIGTIIGARLLVDGAIEIARDFGVTETVIGLTVVAVGTSLPELVACVIAALRRHADVALGNIIGSNIYNVLGILGVTAIAHPIEIPPEIAAFDIWVLLGTTALLGLFLRTGWTLKRWEGGVFLVLYAGYVGYLTI
ncbi:sodium:calcium antiporter [Erythrobacter sp. QSSC1-22B]|uniref:calcium/sodium antiporter n=1 Tax=Erythrobacter sp. QSSC1-22B TaxID=1860125 RepID=UPI000804D0E0|nr:calcium/sodium antiporter [Erythrobacter sp. QSSC1-22B]OBX19238.1 sodium:calcium antiporter [Erythrobacter sp. QSSC1-22B]